MTLANGRGRTAPPLTLLTGIRVNRNQEIVPAWIREIITIGHQRRRFYGTYRLLYHKFGNIVIFGSG